jgi:hypothetical protein
VPPSAAATSIHCPAIVSTSVRNAQRQRLVPPLAAVLPLHRVFLIEFLI